MYTQNHNKKMSGKSISFDNKKSFKIKDIDANKIFISKKNHIVQKMLLNTLLSIILPQMIIKQCLLKLRINSF